MNNFCSKTSNVLNLKCFLVIGVPFRRSKIIQREQIDGSVAGERDLAGDKALHRIEMDSFVSSAYWR